MPSNSSSVLKHVVTILDCFTPEQSRLGVREAARLAKIPPSTVGRLMAEMKDIGILKQDPTSRLYSIGSRSLRWAEVFSSALDLRTVSLPIMEELRETTTETITLYTLEGNERLCVERMESRHNIRMVSRVGMRLPLHAGSAGKAILAFLPVMKQEEILNSLDMKPFTPYTYTDKELLKEELKKIRSQGYSISHREWLMDASGVASPCFGADEEVAGALSISGPTTRFTEEKIQEYAVEVVKSVVQISQLMGSKDASKRLIH